MMKTPFAALLGSILLTLLYVTPSLAQTTSSEDLKELRKEIQAMREELQEIKALLTKRQAPAAPREFVLDLAGKPFKGDRSARLTVIDFTDYQ